jgi:hypothetical protein
MPDLIDLIAVAHDLGWHSTQKSHARGGNHPGVVLHSPVGNQTIHVEAVRQMNERKLDTMRRKVARYGDPVKVTLALATREIPTADAYHDLDVVPAIPNEAPQPRESRWLAHKASNKRGGTMYESEAVIQRDWPSGETDYRCAYEGCGYNSVRPRSVSNHYGARHTQRGETEPGSQKDVVPVTDYTEPLSTRPYVPSKRLIDALAAYISEHIDDGTLSHAEYAEVMLTWAHERPDLPDVEATQREPLTAEQIVERVRMLVGAPLAAVLADYEREMEGLRADVSTMTRTVDDLRAERRALRDLLTEEGGDI